MQKAFPALPFPILPFSQSDSALNGEAGSCHYPVGGPGLSQKPHEVYPSPALFRTA